MNALKIIGIAVVAIIVLVVVIALFINGKYAVEREVSINKPKQQVFDYVKYLKNQNQFSVWAKIDPDMKTEFRGEDATVGFVSAWDSENPKAGKGEQKILKIDEGNRIDYELHFIKPFESTDYAYRIHRGERLNNTGKMVIQWRNEISDEIDAAFYEHGKNAGSRFAKRLE